MKPGTLESIRILAQGPGLTRVNSKAVPLTKRHTSIPNVSIMLEPFDGNSTSAFVSSVSTTSVTVKFSSPFRGYLHLHVVSE